MLITKKNHLKKVVIVFLFYLCMTMMFYTSIFAQSIIYNSSTSVVIDSTAHYWNQSSWDQDKLISSNGYQYTVFWDVDYHLVLSRRNLSNNNIQNIIFPDVCKNPSDGHRSTIIGISLGDGRLHVSYDHHGDPHHYRYSDTNWLTNPPAIISTNQFSKDTIQVPGNVAESRVTYPRYLNDKNGNLYCSYRFGAASRGDEHLNRYNSTTGTWSHIGMMTSQKGTYSGYRGESTSRYSYLFGILFDKNDRLHMAWTWREPGDHGSNHDICYAYSDDYGITWKNNEGKQIADLKSGDPITVDDSGIIVVSAPQCYFMVNSGTMALDSHNQPHIFDNLSTIQNQDANLINPHYKHWWRNTSGTWSSKWLSDTSQNYRGKPYRPRGSIFMDSADNCYCIFTEDYVGWQYWGNPPVNIIGFSWQKGGFVGGIITAKNGSITSDAGRGVDIAESKIVRIRMKNNTSGSKAKLYFITDSDREWNESKSLIFEIVPNDTDYREYTIDLSSKNGWNGTLNQLKFIPSIEAESGTFSIDYIRITNSMKNIKSWEFTKGIELKCFISNASDKWSTVKEYEILNGINGAIEDEGWLIDRRRFANDSIISLGRTENSGVFFNFAVREFKIINKK